jgi:hypothetical protein
VFWLELPLFDSFFVDYYRYNTSVFWRNAWRKVNFENIFEFSLDHSFTLKKNVNLFKSEQKVTKFLKIAKPPWVWLAIRCQWHHNTRRYLHMFWPTKRTMKISNNGWFHSVGSEINYINTRLANEIKTMVVFLRILQKTLWDIYVLKVNSLFSFTL